MSQSGNKPDRPILPPPAPEQEAAAAREAERADRAAERAAEKERIRAERQEAKQTAARVKSERRAETAAAQQAQRREEAERAERDRKARARAEAAAQQTAQQTAQQPAVAAPAGRGRGTTSAAPRRTRKAQLRLTQVDAWSVMKTSFLLSIALGIVLVVAVAIIWAVLGAAGVWDSINSIVQQAVGNAEGPQFDVTDYVGTSRVMGFAMLVAALDVVLITAIATLGAFLYNLSAALLGGIEVTLAEDN